MLSSQDNDLWSEDESPDHDHKYPMPARQIRPKDLWVGIGFCAGAMVPSCGGHVVVVEPGKWDGVDERRQNPGQELKGRELGRI